MEKSPFKGLSKTDLWLAVYGETKHETRGTDHYALQACQYLLTNQMKTMCYLNGVEKNGSYTAEIFRQLAMVFRFRSPDKMSLIKSAGLFNAAIVRKPKNVNKIKQELLDHCSDVLNLANAELTNVNLVEQSKAFHRKIKTIRSQVKQKVKRLKVLKTVELEEKKKTQYEKTKITNVSRIQKSITDQLLNMLKNIMEECVEIKGKPPCEYALLGMGSLAREEITPYSDFEHMIILEEGVKVKDNYEEILEYFRWVSVIFQIIVLNFGETIIPRLDIEGLNSLVNNGKHRECSDSDTDEEIDGSIDEDCNDYIDQNTHDNSGESSDEFTDESDDKQIFKFLSGSNWFYDAYTTCGASPDGLVPFASKHPLGRQKTLQKPWITELIKPVNLMLEYLEREKDIKNGYHLADMLLATCFVQGCHGVYEEFRTGVIKYRKQAAQSGVFSKQIMEDMHQYDTEKVLQKLQIIGNLDVKKDIYRSVTLFIAALGRYHMLDAGSSFDILRELEQKHLCDRSICHSFKFAVSVSLETRLKVYIHCKGQYDNQCFSITRQRNPEDGDFGFVDEVGCYSLYKLFEISLSLQKYVIENVIQNLRPDNYDADEFRNDKIEDETEQCETMNKTRIVFCLGMYEQAMNESEKCLSILNTCDFHQYRLVYSLFMLNRHREATEKCKLFLEENNEFKKKILFVYAKSLLCLERCEEALKMLEMCKTQCHTSDNEIGENSEVDGYAWLLLTGKCLYQLEMYSDLNAIFKQLENDSDLWKAELLGLIANNLLKLGETENALDIFSLSLHLQKNLTPDETMDEQIAKTLNNKFLCLIELDDWEEAYQCKQKEFNIYDNLLEDNLMKESIDEVKEVQLSVLVEKCAIEIENLNFDESSRNLANTLITSDTSGIAFNEKLELFALLRKCYIELKRLDKAEILFNKEVDFRNKFCEDHDSHLQLAECFHCFGKVLEENNKQEKAQEIYQRELTALEAAPKTNKSSKILNRKGNCYMSLRQYEKAITAFEDQDKSTNNYLSILDGTTFASTIRDKAKADHHADKAMALTKLERYQEALESYQCELRIRRQLKQENQLDEAECLINIGFCYFETSDIENALSTFEESCDISTEAQLSQRACESLFQALFGIGKCLYERNSYEIAVNVGISAISILMRSWRHRRDKATVKKWLDKMESCNTCSDALKCFKRNYKFLLDMKRSKYSRNIDCLKLIDKSLTVLSKSSSK